MALLLYIGTQLSEGEKAVLPRYFSLTNEPLKGGVRVRLGEIAVFGKEGVIPLEGGPEDLEDLCVHFEAEFSPFASFVTEGSLPRVDAVVVYGDTPLRPYEVKLTVVPDYSTAHLDRSYWSSEVVVRHLALDYATLSLLKSVRDRGLGQEVRDLVERLLRESSLSLKPLIEESEALERAPQVLDFARELLSFLVSKEVQTPFLLQPTWWTDGVKLLLLEPAFDYVVWSDLALIYLPFYQTVVRKARGKGKIEREATRFFRSVVRFLIVFCQGSLEGKVSLAQLSRLAMGKQTDKAYSIPGRSLLPLLKGALEEGPRISKSTLREVLGCDETVWTRIFRPERRLDATLYIEAILREKEKGQRSVEEPSLGGLGTEEGV